MALVKIEYPHIEVVIDSEISKTVYGITLSRVNEFLQYRTIKKVFIDPLKDEINILFDDNSSLVCIGTDNINYGYGEEAF